MRFILTLIIIAITSLQASTQSDELVGKLNELKSAIQEVTVKKSTFIQELSFSPETPYRIELNVREIDDKGRTEEMRHEVNLAFLDKNLVRWESNRTQMEVTLRSGNQPVIKAYNQGELKGYNKELIILAPDVDNARLIEALFEAAIPLAEQVWKENSQLPDNWKGLIDWLIEHTVDVSLGDEAYRQKLSRVEGQPTRLSLTIEEYSDKGLEKSIQYGWDLADIHLPSIQTEVKGNTVFVESAISKGRKFVREEEDGEVGYANKLLIYADDVDKAQLIGFAIREAAPLAKTMADELLPSGGSLEENLKLLAASFSAFTFQEENIDHSLEAACVATYTLRIADEKSTESSEMEIDIGNLNPGSIDIEVSSKSISVEASISGGQKWIKVLKDGEQKNYTDDIAFRAPDIPTAKNIEHLLTKVIEACPKETPPGDQAWLINAIEQFRTGELEQSLTTRESNDCKLEFKRREDNGKKVSEELLEFNLYDLDPDKAEIAPKGTDVLVEIHTKYAEKIINRYTDGDKLEYVSSFRMMLPDIQTAKKVIATFRALIETCKKE